MNDPIITKVSRKKLDEHKYNKCLQASINYQVYAEIWYLDATAGSNWFCYILNDYEAVMPVPYQKILGIKIISLPNYIQQLGIFYNHDKISNDTFNLFQNLLNSNIVRGYSYNEDNTFNFSPQGMKKCNQIINLNQPYSTIINNYRKNRKYDLKMNKYEIKFLYGNTSKNYIEILKYNYPSLYTKKNHKNFIDLNQAAKIKNHSLNVIGIYNFETIISTFYIISKNRIIEIASVKSKSTKINFTSASVINSVIKKFSNSELIYDFEGSDIQGIYNFNKSFGAIDIHYTYYSNITLFNKIISWVKKL